MCVKRNEGAWLATSMKNSFWALKNCVEFTCFSRKIVPCFRKIWDNRTEKLPTISLSLDFVSKPPSNKPPSGRSEIKLAPGGLDRAFTVLDLKFLTFVYESLDRLAPPCFHNFLQFYQMFIYMIRGRLVRVVSYDTAKYLALAQNL